MMRAEKGDRVEVMKLVQAAGEVVYVTPEGRVVIDDDSGIVLIADPEEIVAVNGRREP